MTDYVPSHVTVGPHTTIEVLVGPDQEFMGLGSISVSGVPLRDGHQPMVIRIETSDGVIYHRLLLREIVKHPSGEVVIRLAGIGLAWGRSRLQDDYLQEFHNLQRPPDAACTDDVELVLRPETCSLDHKNFHGFSWSIRYASPLRSIHRILVWGTWEIGGSITGNTVLSQGQCNQPVWQGSQKDMFTTTCLRTLGSYGSWPGVSFQIGPRAGLVQAFDFQYSDQGVLFQWWPELDSISSILESPPGDDHLHILDEIRFPLTQSVETARKVVLFCPGKSAEHETRDLWWMARAQAYGAIRERVGIEPTILRPEVNIRYETRVVDKQLLFSIVGHEVPCHQAMHAIADHLLPLLAEQGVKRFFPECFTESDVTQMGHQTKLESGLHGDLHCTSICGTHRFFPSDFWGGIAGWRYMYQRAHSLGIELGTWAASHISPRAPIIQQHPEWVMLDNQGMASGGGYGFQTVVVANWNTEYTDWVVADLLKWKNEAGLDFVFIDSLSNMGLVQTAFGAGNMQTNFSALGKAYARLQQAGIKGLTFECTPAFGIGRFGVTDLGDRVIQQDRSVAGQNDLAWWVGNEDMAFDELMFTTPINRSEAEFQQIQFRAAANRGSIVPYLGLDMRLSTSLVRLNRIYEQALPHMRLQRRILPNHAGVMWENGRTRLLWTYTDVPRPVSARVSCIEEHSAENHTGETLPAWGVYQWNVT